MLSDIKNNQTLLIGTSSCLFIVIILFTYRLMYLNDRNDSVHKVIFTGDDKALLAIDVQSEIQAITELHHRLDDDNNGQVDSEESEEFLREELSIVQSSEKCKKFHKGETLVSTEELWSKWVTSTAHNWSCDQVTLWLKNIVEIPELIPVFKELHITGQHLPLFATNAGQILNSFNINKHLRTKLQIKAMDLVLFGPPTTMDSTWKDTVIICMIVLCILGLVYARRKQSLARAKIDNFLEEIRDYETKLNSLRDRLNSRPSESASNSSSSLSKESETVHPAPPSSLVDSAPLQISNSQHNESFTDSPTVVNDRKQSDYSTVSEPVGIGLRDRSYSMNDASENESLRMKVWELECQLQANGNDRIALKSLLQESCLSEWSHLECSRKKAEDEVVNAQKVCDKIKNKRTSVIGAFRLANSSTLEEAGLQITKAVNKMHKIAEQFQEYHSRWKRIEKISQLSLLVSQPSYSSSSTSLGGLSTSDSGVIEYTKLSNTSSRDPPFIHSSNHSRSASDFNDVLPEYGGVTGRSMTGPVMDTKMWNIGSSMDTLERIEEEGSRADKAGSKNVKPPLGSIESNQGVELYSDNIDKMDEVQVGSVGSLTGSESESDSKTTYPPSSPNKPSSSSSAGYGNLVTRSSTGTETPKKRLRLNGLKKSFKLK